MTLNDRPLTLSDILSLEGPLEIRQTRDGPWTSAFCQLASQDLTFYRDVSMSDVVLTFTIAPGTTVETDDTPNPLFFDILADGEFKVASCALTPEDAHRWIEIIRALAIPRPRLTMEDFDILAVIGRGVLGKVMLVERRETKERFAIKSVHKDRLLAHDCTHGILAERNILMFVKNPFIVELQFAFQTPTKFYLGMDYVPGGDLYYHMSTIGQIPFNDARLYTAEIALAIEHLHRFGIVYRDLKAENILLDADGHIKLTDFGLAKEINDSHSKTFCGTHHYLAPEIVLHQEYSYSVDWWALGVLLCEMLSGVPPFEAENMAALLDKIVKEPPTFPTGMEPEVVDLINKLLEKDPTKRIGFDELAAHSLFDDLDWDIIAEKQYDPEWKPQVDGHVLNFDPKLTEEDPMDSIPDLEGTNVDGFSFVSPFANPAVPFLDPELVEEYEGLAKNLAEDQK
jgi:serine/threonine protein kinase